MRVTVFDGDPIACAGWHAVLVAQPWVVSCTETTSAEECLARAAAERPHIVLVGCQRPDGRVFDVCRQLRQERCDVCVIVVCDVDATCVAAARAAGVSVLLCRRWPLERILSVARQVVEDSVRRAGASKPSSSSGTRLSRREMAVLQMVAAGASNPEIALALHLSRHTVKEYTQAVFRKLGVRNRVEAAMAATRLGYVH